MAGRTKKAVVSEEAYTVIKPFRDINDYTVVYEPGDDVSHFDKARLAKLVKGEVVMHSANSVDTENDKDESEDKTPQE